MSVSRSGQYELRALLAEHAPFQVWRGHNLATRTDCVIKVLQNDGTPHYEAVADLVMASVNRHRLVRCRRIITAQRMYSQNGSLTIEYPLLDGAAWQALSHEVLATHWRELILQLAIAVDFLHLRGFVHGDLKLENFLVAQRGSRFDLRMIDLDFLQTDGSKPMGMVFGTPGHIAPEVMTNERVSVQSDNFSIGISLRPLASHLDQLTDAQLPNKGQFQAFVGELTAHDHVLRPRYLTDALHRHALISADEYAESHRQLFGLLAVAHLNAKNRRHLRTGQIERLFLANLRLFGIPAEVVAAIRTAATHSLVKTVRTLRQALKNGRLNRQGEFFKAELADNTLYTLLDHLDAINGRNEQVDPSASEVELLQVMRQLRAGKEPLRALRSFRNSRCSRTAAAEPSDGTVDVWHEAAESALSANRQGEAVELFLSAYRADRSESRFRHLVSAHIAAFRLGGKTRANSILEIAHDDPGFAQHEAAVLQFQRFDAWTMQMAGKFDEAEASLVHVCERAFQLGEHELHVTGTYMRGVVAWRRGEIATAIEHLRHALTLADRYALPQRKASPLIALSQIYCEDGRFLESINLAKLGHRIALDTDQPALTSSAVNSLVSSYARINKPTKAAYWLQQWLTDRHLETAGPSPAFYHSYLAMTAACEGRMEDSHADLLRVLDLTRDQENSQVRQRAWLALGEHAYWRSEPELTDYFQRGMQVADAIKDAEARLECEALLLMSSNELNNDSSAMLGSMAVRLIQMHQSHRVVEIALRLLTWDRPLPEELREFVLSLKNIRGYFRSPLFAAVTTLVSPPGRGKKGGEPDSHQWIRAYQTLSAGSMYFYAMHAALKVADHYLRQGSARRAKNYLLQAQRHARTIGNRAMEHAITVRLDEVTHVSGSEHSWIDSLLTVSDLMKDLGSYQQLLDRLLRFAVDQTGAERGVIFLRKLDRSGLRPMTAYNCDDQSVRELGDFSASIPLDSLAEAVPFFIDDALQDARTNKYQSVVAHNIMSVACVPLTLKGVPEGVLYLDHHALPALFGEADRKLMVAIANLLIVTIDKARELRDATGRVKYLQQELDRKGAVRGMITNDSRLLELLRTLPQIASSPTTVLLLGETGTGKEILCDMIQKRSRAANGPFIKVNCAALAPSLVESELFGIEKNIATGVAERTGKFEEADEGTLFLDEIGDMPLEVQAKVLRVIETGQVERVGSSKSIAIDVRYILATHQDLETMVAEKRFRADLYYRISKIVIEIPPLRDRRDDILLLVDHFLDRYAVNNRPPRFALDAMNVLLTHTWPGNVRQLENAIESCCLLFPGESVTSHQLPAWLLREYRQHLGSRSSDGEEEKARILAALREAKNVQMKAAKLLNMSLTTFRRRLKFYDINSG